MFEPAVIFPNFQPEIHGETVFKIDAKKGYMVKYIGCTFAQLYALSQSDDGFKKYMVNAHKLNFGVENKKTMTKLHNYIFNQ